LHGFNVIRALTEVPGSGPTDPGCFRRSRQTRRSIGFITAWTATFRRSRCPEAKTDLLARRFFICARMPAEPEWCSAAKAVTARARAQVSGRDVSLAL